MINHTHMNKLADLYVISTTPEPNGKFKCNVCGKEYARQSTYTKHIQAQDCFNFSDLFKGTSIEDDGFFMFRELMSVFNPKCRVSMMYFRKAKIYNSVLRLILRCIQMEVTNPGDYVSWAYKKNKPKQAQQLLSYLNYDTSVYSFRRHLIANPNLIDSKSFFSRYGDDLKKDHLFLLRSLQKGHISIQYLMELPVNVFDFDGIVSTMPEGILIDFYDFADLVN